MESVLNLIVQTQFIFTVNLCFTYNIFIFWTFVNMENCVKSSGWNFGDKSSSKNRMSDRERGILVLGSNGTDC